MAHKMIHLCFTLIFHYVQIYSDVQLQTEQLVQKNCNDGSLLVSFSLWCSLVDVPKYS